MTFLVLAIGRNFYHYYETGWVVLLTWGEDGRREFYGVGDGGFAQLFLSMKRRTAHTCET